jgi:hypothetical protein
VDAALAHGDRLLHFDWVACYEFVARRPLLQLARGSMVRCLSHRWRCWG